MTYFVLIFLSQQGPVSLGYFSNYGDCSLQKYRPENTPVSKYECIRREAH